MWSERSFLTMFHYSVLHRDLSLSHVHTQTQKAACHVASCRAVSQLWVILRSSVLCVAALMMIIRELYLHLIVDIMDWASVCVHVCMCAYLSLPAFFHIQVLWELLLIVILIMFEWPVRTQIYLVVSDVIDCQHKKQQCLFLLFWSSCVLVKMLKQLHSLVHEHIADFQQCVMNRSCAKLGVCQTVVIWVYLSK